MQGSGDIQISFFLRSREMLRSMQIFLNGFSDETWIQMTCIARRFGPWHNIQFFAQFLGALSIKVTLYIHDPADFITHLFLHFFFISQTFTRTFLTEFFSSAGCCAKIIVLFAALIFHSSLQRFFLFHSQITQKVVAQSIRHQILSGPTHKLPVEDFFVGFFTRIALTTLC